jgi:ABC-type antimicrobial peptide transport system permease subunit
MSNATNTAGGMASAPAPALTPRREVWLALKSNRGAMAALAIIILLTILCAILAPVLAPHDYTTQNVDIALQQPAGAEGCSSTYSLGTNALGRDLLSRRINGAR